MWSFSQIQKPDRALPLKCLHGAKHKPLKTDESKSVKLLSLPIKCLLKSGFEIRKTCRKMENFSSSSCPYRHVDSLRAVVPAQRSIRRCLTNISWNLGASEGAKAWQNGMTWLKAEP